jgi:hypothetical protein
MTISSQQGRQSYLGDDASTVFPVPFKFFADGDLKVIKQSAAGVDATLTLNVDYTVSGAGDEAGGAITLSMVLATGEKLIIILDPSRLQSTDYVSNDAFPAESHERALDRLTQMAIRTRDLVDRGVRAPDGDVSLLTALPGAAARAGRFLRFADGSGNVEVAAGIDQSQTLSQSVIGGFLYPQTAAETAAGVTPTDFAYPELHFRRYGILGDDSDESAKIQGAIAVAAVNGGTLIAPKQTATSYNLGTTGITIPADVILEGLAAEQVKFDYAGSGFAIDLSGATNGVKNCYVRTSHADAGGLRFNGVSRLGIMDRVTTQCTSAVAADRTGAGFTFRTTSADSGFSGFFRMAQAYSLGYKYGILTDCFELGTKTWTSIVGSQVFLVGAGAGVIANSRGILCTAEFNGIGSSIFGGTIEGFEAPIEVVSGGSGINYYGDIEGSTTDNPILGITSCGEVVAHNSGKFYRGGANGAVNLWFKERHLNGIWIREVRQHHQFVMYENNGDSFFDLYRGVSLIAGGAPQLKWRWSTGNGAADQGANRNYMQFPNGNRIFSDAGSPENVITAPIGSIYMRSDGGAGT